ncbi:hypothetical protein [Azohydromonas australica]|uniref:hypothetical protein n=1 Tax=Azohydromonas australica TaxID=364039 RepID=UPI0012EBDF45|nr:hypothetical protein [Azohydromonas australica]
MRSELRPPLRGQRTDKSFLHPTLRINAHFTIHYFEKSASSVVSAAGFAALLRRAVSGFERALVQWTLTCEVNDINRTFRGKGSTLRAV